MTRKVGLIHWWRGMGNYGNQYWLGGWLDFLEKKFKFFLEHHSIELAILMGSLSLSFVFVTIIFMIFCISSCHRLPLEYCISFDASKPDFSYILYSVYARYNNKIINFVAYFCFLSPLEWLFMVVGFLYVYNGPDLANSFRVSKSYSNAHSSLYFL